VILYNKLGALVKGYFVRRLVKTERVQSLVKTIRVRSLDSRVRKNNQDNDSKNLRTQLNLQLTFKMNHQLKQVVLQIMILNYWIV
jgi:hypothetical protein